MDGSLARKNGPRGRENAVSPGRKPCAQVAAPPSWLVAQPMSSEHPLSQRPAWNTDTRLWPTAAVSGSTSVACCGPGFAYGSALTWTTDPEVPAPAGPASSPASATATTAPPELINNPPARLRRIRITSLRENDPMPRTQFPSHASQEEEIH